MVRSQLLQSLHQAGEDLGDAGAISVAWGLLAGSTHGQSSASLVLAQKMLRATSGWPYKLTP